MLPKISTLNLLLVEFYRVLTTLNLLYNFNYFEIAFQIVECSILDTLNANMTFQYLHEKLKHTSGNSRFHVISTWNPRGVFVGNFLHSLINFLPLVGKYNIIPKICFSNDVNNYSWLANLASTTHTFFRCLVTQKTFSTMSYGFEDGWLSFDSSYLRPFIKHTTANKQQDKQLSLYTTALLRFKGAHNKLYFTFKKRYV